MPDPLEIPLARQGATAFRGRLCGGSRLRNAAAAAALLAAALFATALRPPRPLLVWNGSASSPIGLYWISSPAQVRRGNMVLAWPPEAARRLGAERRYLPWGMPVVKRVAGVAGDRVCAAGHALWVNGALAARRPREDGLGCPLPWWTGCTDLSGGELLLLMADVPGSFDGRYFGPTRERDVIGRARLIWAR
jgi:conjugative transfer signal peptidase TraF